MTAPVDQQDWLDIQASLQGDEQAFACLIGRYEARVASQMSRFTRDHAILEELVQDVFVEVYLSLPGFKGRAPFLHWLRRIATRTGYRYWKRKERERHRRAAIGASDLAILAEPEDRTPFEAAETLHKLIGLLPPKDRLVISLYYFDEYGTAEIAERTGWTRTMVKVRMHRARKRLKNLLLDAGYGSDGHG